MSEMQDNPDRRLEGLLRQWGADEAAREARAHLARREPPRRRLGPVLLRWFPSAAAAVLLLAAGAMFLASRGDLGAPGDAASAPKAAREQEAPAETTVADVQAQIRKIAAENKKLKTERDDLQAAIDLADSRQAAAVKVYIDAENKLRKQIERQAAESRLALDDALARAVRAERDIEAHKTKLIAVTAQRNKARTDLQAVGAEAGGLKVQIDELARRQGEIRKKHDAAVKALAEANDNVSAELARAQRRTERMRAAFQRLYLAAGAPGKTGPAARQITARRMRLIERGGVLQRQCGDERIKAVLNRVDVALTRLDMLDVGDAAAVGRFAASVEASAVVARIDEALALEPEVLGLAGYLRETRMILSGVDGVG